MAKYSSVCDTVFTFSPCVKFRANVSHSDRDIAIEPIFKMAAAAILDLLPSRFLASGTFVDSILERYRK